MPDDRRLFSDGRRQLPALLIDHDGLVRTAALGHLVLDVIVSVLQPLAPADDVDARIALRAGGQAANFAAWASELGASSRFIGTLGDDAAGHLVRSELKARSVEVVGPTRGRSAIVVSLVTENGERTLISDRADAARLSLGDLDSSWFADSDWLHISGYALVEEPLATTAQHAAELARSSGANVSVDLSSANLIEHFGVERFIDRIEALHPTVVLANELEQRVVETHDWTCTRVIKRGQHGCTVITDGTTLDYPAHHTVASDTTGAGDAFAAGFVVGGVDLALDTAARCLASVGAMP